MAGTLRRGVRQGVTLGHEFSGVVEEVGDEGSPLVVGDRVVSLREANLYNLHTDKHVLSVVRVQGSSDGVWSVQANFSVYQSTLDGETDLFAVGTYRDKVVFDNGHPLFAEKIVVNDTFAVARMLSTPI